MEALTKYKEDSNLREAIQVLQRDHVEAAKVNEAAMEKTLRTYNALK
jgi:hypothetical protein